MSVERRRQMIEPEHPDLYIGQQCRLLSLSRSTFYYAPVGESPSNLALMRLIDQAFLECPFYGARQMMFHLRRLGHAVGRKRVGRLMTLMGLSPIYQKPRTSDPHPQHPIYPYLLKNMAIVRPNQVWCADITYIPMRKGFLYLVAVMDWATRKVLAWKLSNTMEADFCIEALQEALARFGRPEIFNTDQGSQFTSPRVHPGAEGRRRADQHGRQGPLDGQRLHRAAVAVDQVRIRLSACLRHRLRAPRRSRALDRLLQLRQAPFIPGWTHARRGVSSTRADTVSGASPGDGVEHPDGGVTGTGR